MIQPPVSRLARSIRLVPVLAVFAACALACRAPSSTKERSVVLVTLDTTRADRLGVYGGKAVPTPAFDALAAEGAVFDAAIANVPLTLPSHATIFTGRYPASHGVRHNGIYRLPGEAVTLAERLHERGYATAAFVAAYVLNRGFGAEQGFDTYDDVAVAPAAGADGNALEAQRSADEVNAAVFRWLDGKPRGPFFLWVHYYDPHIPYAPPEKPGRVLHGSGYDREISYLDACFGDLVAKLKADGLLDDAIVAVAGDHGESLGEHGEETHGLLLYEGALRIPMFLRAPGLVPAGTRVAGPASLVDLAPTLLDLLGVPPSPQQEGRSLVARIRGEERDAGGFAFAETLMGRLEYGWSELYAARGARYKYVQAPTPELYDLQDDPAESRNLAPLEADRAADAAASVAEWRAAAENSGGKAEATRTLSAEEEARLRSLGYLGGDAFKAGAGGEGGARPDPKVMIEEAHRVSRARARVASGDLDSALAEVERILAANPRNRQARLTRVDVLCRLGRFADAEDEARAGVSLARTGHEASTAEIGQSLGLLGSTLARGGKLADAEATFREMLKLDPAGEEAAVELARLLANQGRYDESLALLRDVLGRNPASGAALSIRFVVETKLGRRDDALATAQALATASSGDAAVLADAGDLLFKSGRVDRAIDCYAAAVARGGSDPLLLGKLGTGLLAAGRVDEAKKTFRDLLRVEPRSPAAHLMLGEIALKEGNERGARAEFDEALRIDPRFTPPLVSLGRWLARNGRSDEARRAFEDALRRNPADAQAKKALEAL